MRLPRTITGTATVVTFLLVITVAVLSSIQTKDIIMLPAPAEAIDTHISIAGHPLRPHRGTFYITFVDEPQSTLLTKLYESFNPDATIIPEQVYYGNNVPSTQQQQQQNVAFMIDSKTEAELAAFRASGYHPRFEEQLLVQEISAQSKALGKLQVNDVILQANGHPIHTSTQLRAVVQALRPGAPVTLLISRPAVNDDQIVRLSVPTIRLSGKAAIGIRLQPSLKADLPLKVTIDSGDIQGPSAGLMFALSIVNRLSPLDLTHGHKIAGTGTIDLFGNVGPIGGVKQKVIGARQAGAQYFFVPVDNYAEARPYAQGITLIRVNTLQQALSFLRELK